MRVAVDRAVCEGLGMCEAMAHEVFQVDDDEVLQILDPSPPESQRGVVAAAVASCPVQALRLEE